MKKIITDNFDKLLMLTIFMIIFSAYLYFMTDVLGQLSRDAFLVMTALVGYRRLPTPTQSANTESGDINVIPESNPELDKIEPSIEGLDIKEKEL